MKTTHRYLVSLNPDDRPFLHGEWRGMRVFRAWIVVEPFMAMFAPKIGFHVLRELLLDEHGVNPSMHVEHRQSHLWVDETPDPMLHPLIQALAAGEIRGAYETDSAHALFWSGMVQKPGGLHALSTVDRELAKFWARSGWDGSPCPTCNRVRGMVTRPDHGSPEASDPRDRRFRRCSTCHGAWTIDNADLYAAVLVENGTIPPGSSVSK